MSEVVEAWHDVTRQVEAADLLLGVQFDTPEREPERGAFMPYNEGQGYER